MVDVATEALILKALPVRFDLHNRIWTEVAAQLHCEDLTIS